MNGCYPGDSRSGDICTRSDIYQASTIYSCNVGDTLNGRTCTHVQTYNAAASYSCPSGGTLSGTVCTRTSTYSATAARTLAYDGNGNMTSDGLRGIIYDYDNMPMSVTRGSLTTSFVYDGEGTRVKKVTPTYTTVYIDKQNTKGDVAA